MTNGSTAARLLVLPAASRSIRSERSAAVDTKAQVRLALDVAQYPDARDAARAAFPGTPRSDWRRALRSIRKTRKKMYRMIARRA